MVSTRNVRASRRAVLARGVLLTAVFATAIAFLAAGIRSGFGQPEKKPAKADPGLGGILIDEVPDALVLEEFDPLGKEWAKWGEAVSNDLLNLYDAEAPSAGKQRQAIAALRGHLKKADASIAAGGDKKIQTTLVSLRGKILRRIDLAEAALNTLDADPVAGKKRRIAAAWPKVDTELNRLSSHINEYQGGDAWQKYLKMSAVRTAIRNRDAGSDDLALIAARIDGRNGLPNKDQRDFLSHQKFLDFSSAVGTLLRAHNAPVTVSKAKLRAELKKMFAAFEKYEATNSSQAAAQIRSSFDALEDVAPDGGAAIAKAMRVHYFNYNLRIYVSERFMNRFIAECRTERGTIRDQVMEAQVFGNQVTTTNIAVDLKRSNNRARFDITLAGRTNSRTVGRTSLADIYTSGHYQFWARKEIQFDGYRFYPYQQARISVNANSRTTGAKTKLSWIPLLGRAFDRIAVNEATKRRPQSEAYARNKVYTRVSGEFNKEVETKFAEANKDYRDKVVKPTEEAGLKPNAQSVRTTEELLLVSSRVMNNAELAGAASNPNEAPGWGVTIRLHESAMNNAFDRLDIKGRTLTEEQLTEEITKPLKDILPKKKETTEPKPKKKSTDQFIFDSQDPIRFRARKGQMFVILRTGLKRDGEKNIPTQIITIPLTISIVKDKIRIKRGIVGVAPAKTPENRAEQIAMAGIMRNKISEAIQDREVERVFKLGQDGGQKTMRISINRISTNNGWVSVWAK